MKKVVLALGCVAMFGLASCNKEITCDCQFEMGGMSQDYPEFTVEADDCKDAWESEYEEETGQDINIEDFGVTCEEV